MQGWVIYAIFMGFVIVGFVIADRREARAQRQHMEEIEENWQFVLSQFKDDDGRS